MRRLTLSSWPLGDYLVSGPSEQNGAPTFGRACLIPQMLEEHFAKALQAQIEARGSSQQSSSFNSARGNPAVVPKGKQLRPITKADLRAPENKAFTLPKTIETSSKSRTYPHITNSEIIERDDRKKETVEAKAPTADQPSSSEAAQQQALTASKNPKLITDDQPDSLTPAPCDASMPKEPPSSSTIPEVEDAAELKCTITEYIDSWNPRDFEGTWRIIDDGLPSLLHPRKIPMAEESTSMKSGVEDAGEEPCKIIDVKSRVDSWERDRFAALWQHVSKALAEEELLRPAGSWRAGTPATWKELFNASRECMPLLENYITFHKSTHPGKSFEAKNQELTALANVVANVCRFLRLHRSDVPATDVVTEDCKIAAQLQSDQRKDVSFIQQIEQLQTEFNRMKPQWEKMLPVAGQQKGRGAEIQDELRIESGGGL